MPNFDPAQALPDDQEPTVQTVPISQTAGGQAYVGAPSVADPSQLQAEQDALQSAALKAHAELAAFNAANPGLGGAPGPAAPTSPPALALVPPAPSPAGEVAPTPAPPPPAPPAAAPSVPRGTPAGAPTPPDKNLLELATAATVPTNPQGDAVDRELAAASAPAPGEAKPGDLAASSRKAQEAEAGQEAALREQGIADRENAMRERVAKEQQARDAAAKAQAQEADRRAADEQIRAARQAAASKPFHSYWQDKSVGQRIVAMLGIMLGGVSFDKNARNEAAEIVQANIARDFERQKEEHAQLWKDVETAQQQGQALRSNQLQEMSTFRTNQALQLEAVIAKGNELAANAKNAVGLAALKSQNAKLEFARDQAFEEARRLAEGAKNAERHQLEEEKQGRERLAIERGHLGVARANAATGKAAAEELKVGKALDAQLNRDKVTTGRLAALDKLQEAKAAIASGNPVAIQGAIDGYVRAQTGLGARPGSIKLFTDRLGGSWEQLQAWISEKKTGALPPAMIKRFSSAVDSAANENTEALKKSRGLHEKALLASPEYKRHADIVKAHLDDRFSAVMGAPETTGGGLTPADQAAISWAKGHAGDPRAVKILQLHGM